MSGTSSFSSIPIINSQPQFTVNNTLTVFVSNSTGTGGNDVTLSYNFFGTKFSASGALAVTDPTRCSNTQKSIIVTYTAKWVNPFTNVTTTFSDTVSKPLLLCYTDFSHSVSAGLTSYVF